MNQADSRMLLVQWWFLYGTRLSWPMVFTQGPFRKTLNWWDQCSVDPVARKLHEFHWPNHSYDLARGAHVLFFEFEGERECDSKGHLSIIVATELAFLKWLLGSLSDRYLLSAKAIIGHPTIYFLKEILNNWSSLNNVILSSKYCLLCRN